MSFSVRLVRSLGLGFMLGFDVEPDRDLGRAFALDLRLLSAALCRCICKFAVARFTFV